MHNDVGAWNGAGSAFRQRLKGMPKVVGYMRAHQKLAHRGSENLPAPMPARALLMEDEMEMNGLLRVLAWSGWGSLFLSWGAATRGCGCIFSQATRGTRR